MNDVFRRETRHYECVEAGRTATLTIEWRREGNRLAVSSVTCDNPRLRDTDNWDCRWTCLKNIEDIRE